METLTQLTQQQQQQQQQQIGCLCADQKMKCGCSSHYSLPPPEKRLKLTSHDEDEDDDDEEEEEYDSDVEFYEDGSRDMTKKESRKYDKQVAESDGFDVDDFPDVLVFGMIKHLTCLTKAEIDEFSGYAKLALQQYNTSNGTNVEFAKIIKANTQVECMIKYYITFEVLDLGESRIFQALVLHEPPPSGLRVLLCRPKPTP